MEVHSRSAHEINGERTQHALTRFSLDTLPLARTFHWQKPVTELHSISVAEGGAWGGGGGGYIPLLERETAKSYDKAYI